MKSTTHSASLAQARLICTRCGMVAQPGTLGWRALTAVSHAGPTVAAELAGHEVALDLCRPCMRNVLRSALGMDTRHAALNGRRACPATDAGKGLRSMCDAEAYIAASNARLAAWRNGEVGDDSDSA